jgi:hypothetical protein
MVFLKENGLLVHLQGRSAAILLTHERSVISPNSEGESLSVRVLLVEDNLGDVTLIKQLLCDGREDFEVQGIFAEAGQAGRRKGYRGVGLPRIFADAASGVGKSVGARHLDRRGVVFVNAFQ